MKKEILSAIGIIAGILFGTTLSLSAQEKLSLKQCREMALKYNKEMAAADRQTEAARLMSLSYKANFFPNFTANGTGIYSTADGSLGIPGGNLPVFMPNPTTGELVSSGFAYFPGLNLDYKVGTVYSGGIQMEQPLYMGGKIRAAYKMSLLGKEMAHLNEALTTSEVLLNTDKAYVQLVKAKEMKKVAEKYHALLTELSRNVKSAHQHGMKPQNDVLKVQVKLNDSELSLRKADNALRLASMNLCHYIGRPLTTQIDISDDFPEVEQEWKIQVSDITARPEYGILNKQVAIAEQEVKRARAAEQVKNREVMSTVLAEKEPEEQEMLQDVEYEYHLGDKVYIGASEYEILSVDDERVMLYDYDMPLFNKEFSRTEFDRKVRENPMNEHLIVKEEPAEERNETEEVQTNMGSMPIEDYREIVASQSGFDSYDEMYHQGYRIGNGYDKEPEPVVPAWEQKKKVKGFDLHPDVSMAERHTFNLKENEVETVGKKERFRRNIMAIQLLKKCQEENRFATPEEQILLSKYVGWGGLSEAFDENNSAWATEYLELSSVLTPEEYASARESTLTAFYTPPEVITAIYKAMEQMGFKEGNLLEPSCGIGNFIGMLPDTMQDSKIYGVELDTISAGIAQQLYQKTTIAAQGFEETNLPDSFFDGVVGNVPFGDFKVLDKRYDKHKFLIHDYFFAKSLDKLRPGGVMALVTSKGTMDKETLAVRKYIAQRAELLGAIRLPNNTFKGNAGTEVVSDILILQKRDRLIDIEPDWVHLDTDENGIKMNSYFVQHPEMILGEMKMVSGRFGMEATCVPYENADLAAQLDEAVANIHGEITEYEAEEELEEEDNSIPADPAVRNFSYTVVDDKIYYRENSRMTPVEVSATAENRIKGMIAIRNSVRTLIELQTEDYPDSEIKAEQERLNRLYDTFSGKYGLINSRANTSAFSQDSSFSLLSALEIIGEDGELERKADMFSKRTIKPHTPVTSVDTASEALAVSLGEKATIDMDYMMELSGKSENEIFEDLKGVIFLNPLYEYGNSYEPKYLMADEYLSGNVREKLKIAKNSAELYPEDYKVNVEALQKVQPKDLTASEISVRLGATWLPPDDVQEFIFHLLETPRYAQWNIKVHFSPFTSEWNIEGKSYDKGNVRAYNTYGTSRINAYKIIEETLNLKDVRIFDYIEDDEGKKKAVLNKKETAIAQSKQEMIKQEFQDWIWSDPERRERLCKSYNEKFNSVRPREYDGSHIIFNGMNPEIQGTSEKCGCSYPLRRKYASCTRSRSRKNF